MGSNGYDNFSDGNSKYLRKMSNFDRLVLWSPNTNVTLVTRIMGNVSEEKLHQALNNVRQIHPLIGTKILFDDDYNAWFSTKDVPQPKFNTIHRVSDVQWLEELQDEIQHPFKLETGPLIHIILVYSEEMFDLVIIGNHSICDGMSLAYLIRDLLISYVNPKQEIRTINPPDIMDILPKAGFSLSSILTKLYVIYANRRWKKNPYYFNDEDYSAIQTAYWQKYRFCTVLLELNSEEAIKLSKQCKKNNITIGSAVTAAFIAAHEDMIGPFSKTQKQTWIPFDLRRHATIPIEDAVCSCAGSLEFSFTYDFNKSFWENAALLHRIILKQIEKLDSSSIEIPDLEPTLLDALSAFTHFKNIVPEAYTKTENLKNFSKDSKNIAYSLMRMFEGRFPGTISSNLGKLNIPVTYGNLQIDRMVFLPGGSDTAHMILGGVSINDKLVYSLFYRDPRDNDSAMTKNMIQIRDNALEYLGF